jgi:hypothetical protein
MSAPCETTIPGTVCVIVDDEPATPVIPVVSTDDPPVPTTDTTVPCDNGLVVGHTPSGQPLFLICGPADPLPGQPTEPVADFCIPGVNQMSRSLLPCDDPVYVGQQPADNGVTQATVLQAPHGSVLPDTGAHDVTPLAGTAGALVALGVALVALQRRCSHR